MQENYSLIDALKAIIKWKKLLILVTLSALVLSVIIALLLPNYYKSTQIFYPYSLKALDPKNMINPDEVVDIYGNGDDIERLRQIGISNQLADHMIKKFNLFTKYNVDSTETLASFKARKEFFSNYSMIKNDLGALEVNIFDKDPNIAAAMANEAVNFVDSINLIPVNNNNNRLLSTLEATIKSKESDLNLIDSLTEFSNNNHETSFSKLTSKSIIQSQKTATIENKVMEKLFLLVSLKEKYAQMKNAISKNYSSIYVIEKATPSPKKAKPVRWVIVLSSTLFAFFFTILAIVFLEYFNKNIKEELKNVR